MGYDTVASNVIADGATCQIAITVANVTNRVLIAYIGINSTATSVVSLNSDLGPDFVYQDAQNGGNSYERIERWICVNPTAGARTYYLTLSAADAYAVCAIVSFNEIDQTTPVANSNKTSGSDVQAPSWTVSSSSDQFVVDAVSLGGTDAITMEAHTNRTERLNDASGIRLSVSTTIPGAASVTSDWAFNGVAWAGMSVSLAPASGGSSTPITKNLTESLIYG